MDQRSMSSAKRNVSAGAALSVGTASERLSPASVIYPPIEELLALVGRAAEASHARTTRKAYACCWRKFEGFCANYNKDALPATIETVCLFLAFRAKCRLSNRTIRGDRSAIGFMHRKMQYGDPTIDPRVTMQIMGHARTHGSCSGKMRELTTADVRGMCRLCDEMGGANAIRNKAALLVAFSGALRSAELCALVRSDVTSEIHGLGLLIRRSKTDQEGRGYRKSLVRGKNPSTDPVVAVDEWCVVYAEKLGREIAPNDPLFPGLSRWGDVENADAAFHRRNGKLTHMSSDVYRKWLKVLACAANPDIDPREIGGHSLRAGHATTAASNGVSRSALAVQGPWKKSETMDEYIRPSRAASDSSSAYLGL